jgi:transcriptional regulator with XRE-family HTH domain
MLTPPAQPVPAMAVSNSERAFYVQLGQRIAALRRERNLTQVQLADAMGVAQQTLAHYEAGRLRLLAGALAKQIEQISQLPRAKQKFVMDMLNTVIQQAS